ncbi:MAG TPA: hypothetical protein VMK32_03395 [Burkholderiaceae bacterium]|nr:hypothetical protein [Burkholderiaceae bacterium]
MSASKRNGLRSLAIVAALGGLIIAGPAAATPWPGERVAIHSGYAVFGGRAYADVDELSNAVRAAHPVSLEVIACGPDAVEALVHTVPYLASVALVPQVADAANPACLAPVALPVGTPQAFASKGTATASRYWSQVAP